MGSKWQSATLGDLLNSGEAFLQTGPFGTALKANEYTPTGVPLISVREIREGHFQIEDATPRVDHSVISRLPKFVLKTGDIVFARKGGIERNALVTDREDGWFLGSDGIFLRVKEGNDSRFFSYVMRSPLVKTWLIKNSEGTTMPSLNQKILSRIPIYLPPVKEQIKIASWLGDFDNKITLNRQINQTLEQMAQTLFKSWFVDFDPVIDNALDAGNVIPDELQARAEQRQALRSAANKANAENQPQSSRTNPAAGEALATPYQPLPDNIRQLFPSEFEESELGWVPKGWGVSTAGDELTIKGGSTPSTKNPEFWENGDINWTSPKDLSGKQDKIMLDTERKITKAGLDKITSGLLPPETVLMSSRAPVGYLALTKIPLAINQGYIAIPESKSLTKEYILYWLDSQVETIKSISGGTTFAEISKKTFRTIPLIVPPSDVVSAFSKMASLYLNKITKNIEESSSLCSIRDSLLPKLISGELEIE